MPTEQPDNVQVSLLLVYCYRYTPAYKVSFVVAILYGVNKAQAMEL